ncbi:odorant receptor Or1 [Asbolus verrucosus]|uniref:Odorant receptor n=1 Tax=Asbolus verrucosus TaxID=1661398 RepID=A0A482VHN3_ASBVE|nr:odorant receptor Or1 [Asbolus verrucosus]
MKKFDWVVTIRLNIFILKLVGLWPKGNESYKFNFYTFYAIISITFFVYGHNMAQTFNIFFVINDLEAITGTIVVSLTLSLSIIKTYFIIRNMATLKNLMVILNSDMFQPKSTHQKNLVKSNLREWKMFYMVFLIMTWNSFLVYITFPIFDKSVKEYRLPLMAWYPYDTKTSPSYEITYVYQFVSALFIATTNVNIDTLIAALNMYVGAQCDILCDDLRNLRNEQVPGDIDKAFINCISHHKNIVKFAEDSNKFFNWIVFAQFFTSVISIGLSLFQLTVVTPFTNEFFTYIIYGMAIIVEIFMFCWFGNEVEIKSKNIPYATFESDWTAASLEVKKKMVFFAMRCQRPIKLSALNLFYLSLDNFKGILRSSWSYFAVLYQVNTIN